MFGHLKAEEFVNLVEGVKLPSERHAHLGACARCSAAWKSMESVHKEFSSLERLGTDIPEPDWDEFRNSVRSELLSRSVQRASAVRRWTGWPIRPAMAWGLSLVIAVAVTTGGFLWVQRTAAPVTVSSVPVAAPVDVDTEANVVDSAISDWSQTDLFDELVNLEEQEQETLRLLLTVAQQ